MTKLTKEKAEAKKRFHQKRVEFYSKKLEEIEKESKRIGFKFY